MSNVKRIFVEKRPGFDVPAQALFYELQEGLGLDALTSVRIVNRYDVEGISQSEYQQARSIVFSEPTVDVVYDEQLPVAAGERMFAIEFLPGQYDQTADSAAQCIQILTQKERPLVAAAKVVMMTGAIDDEAFERVKQYCINAVECREASLEKPATLTMAVEKPDDVAILTGFIGKSQEQLHVWMEAAGLAMSFDDLKFCQTYFRDVEQRDPSITEIKVIDTYWSDHCRHTTFFTNIQQVSFEDGVFVTPIREAYAQYLNVRAGVYGAAERAVSLMDMATIGMKELRRQGLLADLDQSEEINACSICVPVDVDGTVQDWLVMFKNETHNHPTEIEPFGGAATCLGGAIRDPLSGRSYVYQAMRLTGSADPRACVKDTLPGKLPQKKITTGAAAGYSSYGNQIGLSTGYVAEVYHDDFVAKRMEIGAVIAAAPRENVVRAVPQTGDVVILVGGRTGRDGCGGATGSSKEHTEQSLVSCGAEVQKGNAPTERKLQRLFRNPQASRMVKRCNDFGAGGVAVAIGELTEGLIIQLDDIPKKYEGLDGTELAISESQERMAVVVNAVDAAAFIDYAAAENVEATIVAEVTDCSRLQMMWRGKLIVDISREFLNTNGVQQSADVHVQAPARVSYFAMQPAAADSLKDRWLNNLRQLNVCSQKGLVEMFDSTIGAGTVLMPFGGQCQLTPSEGMVAKIPVLTGDTATATAMTYGYDPALSKWSPFHGGLYAVVEAAARIAALGGDYASIRLTLQEYFERLGQDAAKWGKPFSALLGALHAQLQLGLPAIGGKDSMSGTFHDLHVPPTLVAFAVDVMQADHALSPEFKSIGSTVVVIPAARDCCELPDFAALKRNFSAVAALAAQGRIRAAHSVRYGGIAAAVSKMAFGNTIGLEITAAIGADALFSADYGSLILEVESVDAVHKQLGDDGFYVLGTTRQQPAIVFGDTVIDLEQAQLEWRQPLEKIFPTQIEQQGYLPDLRPYQAARRLKPAQRYARPRVFIPVFPGTNCEYDSARAFEQAGGLVDTLVIRNLTPAAVEQSVERIARSIANAQIVMLPGGFSAGDEPDGSGKFIAAMFRNTRIQQAVMQLLQQRDGLMMGICNGFQALIKLGLVPYGEIVALSPDCPTLTHNAIGRHISCMTRTRVVSNKSPWFCNAKVGDIHTIAVSHGEGRFVGSSQLIDELIASGQVATQYVDCFGNPSLAIEHNPNGSMAAIEAITSPDGRVLGKMGHSERVGVSVGRNVAGEKQQGIFAAGIYYFS